MVKYEKNGAVATIRFDRPEKKNAITVAMYEAMVEALDDSRKNEEIHAVNFLGGDVFTAGNDIADFLAAGTLDNSHPTWRFLRALREFPKPLVAGVRGAAIGIGTTLIMHCDAVVAGNSAKFSMPFTKLALVPEAGSSVLFPLIAGRMRASWYILSGEAFGPSEAKEMGLVTRVVEDAAVEETVAAMCATLAELPPNSIATTKRLLKAQFTNAIDAAMNDEIFAFAAALRSEEARSAFMKFMQRA